MDEVLTRFVRALRGAGLATSTAETLDAARAIALVGYAGRDRLKEVLGATLAKSEPDREVHDQVFDQFFSLPAGADDPGSPALASAQPGTGDPAIDALASLADSRSADGGNELALALQDAARSVDLDGIRFQSQVPYYVRRMLEHLGLDPLDKRLAQRLAEPGAAAGQEARRLQAARDALRRSARAVVQQRFDLFGRTATASFMAETAVERAIGAMTPSDLTQLEPIVRRLARRLAQRHAQRRRVLMRGQLDLRRTLRANAGHDNVPVTLAFRHRRRERPRIVAVCDVSGSVAPHARFLLLFLYALHDAVSDLRSFAFSGRLAEVGPALQGQPFDEAMAGILRHIGSGSTDYGQAWQDLQDRHADCIDRRTTVLVLGDARSNHADPRLDLFGELVDRARRVIWLCPEAPSRWGTGDSCLLQYRPFCHHVSHCATPLDLERVIDEALGSYD